MSMTLRFFNKAESLNNASECELTENSLAADELSDALHMDCHLMDVMILMDGYR